MSGEVAGPLDIDSPAIVVVRAREPVVFPCAGLFVHGRAFDRPAIPTSWAPEKLHWYNPILMLIAGRKRR